MQSKTAEGISYSEMFTDSSLIAKDCQVVRFEIFLMPNYMHLKMARVNKKYNICVL